MKTLSSKQKENIQYALNALLQRTNHDAFVIITEITSGKFVQFTTDGRQLFFDLPTQQFNRNQLDQVTSLLTSYEIFSETHSLYDSNTSSRRTGEITVFAKNLESNVELALEVIERLITEIYAPDKNIKLDIEEN